MSPHACFVYPKNSISISFHAVSIQLPSLMHGLALLNIGSSVLLKRDFHFLIRLLPCLLQANILLQVDHQHDFKLNVHNVAWLLFIRLLPLLILHPFKPFLYHYFKKLKALRAHFQLNFQNLRWDLHHQGRVQLKLLSFFHIHSLLRVFAIQSCLRVSSILLTVHLNNYRELIPGRLRFHLF